MQAGGFGSGWVVGTGGVSTAGYGGTTVIHGPPIGPQTSTPIFTYVG